MLLGSGAGCGRTRHVGFVWRLNAIHVILYYCHANLYGKDTLPDHIIDLSNIIHLR